jgi:8-oxo-dGTP pyrophosphatase MutT (NUDIX family)
MSFAADPRAADAGGTIIRIVAGIATDALGHVLMVRKRGTSVFMLPGGKPAAGEAAIEALAREVTEEVGCTLERTSAVPLGRFRAPAANEPGHVVEAELFRVTLTGTPVPQSEIEELRWLDPHAPGDLPLAALARSVVLPRLHRQPKAAE